MSRLGRSQPVQPFASHGFLGNTPANGVLPPRPTLVENDGRRQIPQRLTPLQPLVSHGFLGNVPANGALPPFPTVAPLYDERRRQLPPPLPFFSAHGFVDSGVGVPGTTPPPPASIDRVDQRGRYLPLPPITISAALQAVTGSVPLPPAPFVVPLDERRRFLTALAADVLVGYDDADPPLPNVVEPDDRRRRRALAPDPTVLSAATTASTPPFIPPPGPFVVPLTERNRLLERLPTLTVSHGFVDPGPAPVGTTPPPVANIDRADQRARYLPLSPLVLSGVLIPFVPPPPPVVLGGTDWAPAIASV